MAEKSPNQFIITPWSLLLTESDDGARSQSLQILCDHYRAPVHDFFSRQCWDAEDADDLTQSFFTHLIEKEVHKKADPARGRFRSFLLTSAKNFLLNHRRYCTRQKRSSNHEHSFDQTWVGNAGALDGLYDKRAPDRDFDMRWAMALFDAVWDETEQEYADSGKLDRFEALAPSLMNAGEADTYQEIAVQLGLSEQAVKSAAFRLRQRFRELFRSAVARLVDDPNEIDDEIRYLLNLIRES